MESDCTHGHTGSHIDIGLMRETVEDIAVQTHRPCVIPLCLERIREVLPAGVWLPAGEGLRTDNLVSIKAFAVNVSDGRGHLQGLAVLVCTYPELTHGDICT